MAKAAAPGPGRCARCARCTIRPGPRTAMSAIAGGRCRRSPEGSMPSSGRRRWPALPSDKGATIESLAVRGGHAGGAAPRRRVEPPVRRSDRAAGGGFSRGGRVCRSAVGRRLPAASRTTRRRGRLPRRRPSQPARPETGPATAPAAAKTCRTGAKSGGPSVPRRRQDIPKASDRGFPPSFPSSAPRMIPEWMTEGPRTNFRNKSARQRLRPVAGADFCPVGGGLGRSGQRFSCQPGPSPISGARVSGCARARNLVRRNSSVGRARHS